MASRETVYVYGYEIRVSPKFWLRRWTPLGSLYFDSTNPRFFFDVKRVTSESHVDKFAVQVAFDDTSFTSFEVRVPPLDPGEKMRIKSPAIHTSRLGPTQLRIKREDGSWFTAYSYRVRGEETWALGLASAVIATVGGAAGAIITVLLAK